MNNWLDKVVEILDSDTGDLRILAQIAGADPKIFYRGINLDGADIRGQDLRGLDLKINIDKSYIDNYTQISPDQCHDYTSRSSKSYKRFEYSRSWARLEEIFEKNEAVQGVICNQVNGGFTVDLDGAVAFLPRSQVDVRPVKDVGPLMQTPQ
ncbi:S1 RNA-binding domain-containing protein, partial [Afifella sp. H1R]|uniref:S1 RNA-binding domain-containing protein n=1 Tax=Afifella sp. H1R TaxID=2908841 RepID=UPI001F1BCD20